MRKKVIISLALSSFGFISAQVGVNTTTPAATMDIVAKKNNGTASDVEGLLIPRLDRQRAQSMDLTSIPESTLIYVENIETGTQTGTAAKIDAVGYYFFNGSEWLKLNNNLYNSDGVVSATRTITTDGNTVNFINGNNSVIIASGTTANPNEGKITAHGSSKGSVEISGGSGTNASTIDVFSDINSSQIVTKGESKNLTISTQSTNPAPIILKTNDVNRLIVAETGKVGIGNPADNSPAQTLHVEGTTRITGSAGTPIGVMGRNRSGDVGTVYIGEGLSLTQGTLSAGDTHISNVVFPFIAIQPADEGKYILDSRDAPNYTIWNSKSNANGDCDVQLLDPRTVVGRTLNIIAALHPVDVCTETDSSPLTWRNSTRIGVIPQYGRVTIQATDVYGGMWVITMKDFSIN